MLTDFNKPVNLKTYGMAFKYKNIFFKKRIILLSTVF